MFTAEIFERANRANQLSKGIAQAFASFRCIFISLQPLCKDANHLNDQPIMLAWIYAARMASMRYSGNQKEALSEAFHIFHRATLLQGRIQQP